MRRYLKVAITILLFIAVSCAIITVNIYFPEKEVKEAYKALEKELMTPDKGEQPETKTETKPESSLRFEFMKSANAQEEGLAEKIAETIKRMPDVVQAYKEMGARIADIDKLRDKGMVGEGNNGLLAIRQEGLTAEEKKLIEAENENRGTVINGMAKAIVRINRLPENEENLKQVLSQATQQFAALRRDSAKKGWWIQDLYGNWNKK